MARHGGHRKQQQQRSGPRFGKMKARLSSKPDDASMEELDDDIDKCKLQKLRVFRSRFEAIRVLRFALMLAFFLFFSARLGVASQFTKLPTRYPWMWMMITVCFSLFKKKN
jgi:hypothetical protein